MEVDRDERMRERFGAAAANIKNHFLSGMTPQRSLWRSFFVIARSFSRNDPAKVFLPSADISTVILRHDRSRQGSPECKSQLCIPA